MKTTKRMSIYIYIYGQELKTVNAETRHYTESHEQLTGREAVARRAMASQLQL